MDYFGPTGTNIELVCTENNADAGNQGRQSTSLVDALYLADSLGQISKTEFNSFVWWDLRNGPDTNGDFDPSLYGWRTNGDLGIMLGTDTRYPTYYGMKMMQYLAQPGDTILNPGSSDSSLAIYAAQTAAGAVNMLVINKDPSNTLTRPMELAGYTPNSLATIRSFGIPQDEATRTNSVVPGAQDIATNSFPTASGSFNYSFPPYSLTMFSLSPTAPAFMVMSPSGQSSNVFVFQLAGQPGVSYVLQTSSDLAHWTPVVTNKLAASVVSVTNPILPGAPKKFWRALWQP
jgi:alpha-L-arabinofuranosidase